MIINERLKFYIFLVALNGEKKSNAREIGALWLSIESIEIEAVFNQGNTAWKMQRERFIQEIYARKYQANIQTNYSRLINIYVNNKILAAVGFRDAKQKPLFLEQGLKKDR